MFLDRIASMHVFHGETRFLEEAESWARRACELVPECKSVRGTLGSILVERGRYADGLALLMPLTLEDNEPVDRACSSFYIAKAFRRLHDHAQADKWMETARSYGDRFGMLSRIESELGRH